MKTNKRPITLFLCSITLIGRFIGPLRPHPFPKAAKQ